MTHARNAECQAEKSASKTANTTDQVELDINDNTNTDTAVTAMLLTISMRYYSLLMKQPSPRFHFDRPQRVNH